MERSSSVRRGLACAAAPGRMVLNPAVSAFAMVGQSFDEGDDAGRGHCARAHRLDVSGPKVAGCHLRDGHQAGIDGMGNLFAEKVNERHDHEPREHAAGEDDARNARPDDVAHAEIFTCRVGVDGCALEHMLRPEVGLIRRLLRPRREEIAVLEEGVKCRPARGREKRGWPANRLFRRR